ncbi:MAG: cofactor-independent phosphoglycerate mutase [Deltaproteobacteria bacterium]|nr:cofactor-independent phosphoglycerate mutase [Deltaproteobacteria bacterium]
MKYLILLGDGIADYPLEKLGNKTPLEYAHTPNMDRMAGEGTIGLIDTAAAGLAPGSDVANLTVLGYDAGKIYSGRGPLEAANMGVKLGPDDVAFRCNLITLGGGDISVMEDFTAGHISSGEAKEIIEHIGKNLGSDEFQFYPGVSYRHLLVWRNGKDLLKTVPPHNITGRTVGEHLPRGEGADRIRQLMKDAEGVLQAHPVNKARQAAGKKIANAIWLWGQGKAPNILPITNQYRLRGGMISAVDLLNGIAIYAGLEVLNVAGATGYTDTNYVGKAHKALEALTRLDFVFLHVEAPDEMGHEGNIEGKVRAIEDFDEKVVGTVLKGMDTLKPMRVMVLSDHPTPVTLMNHASDPSPFAVLSSIKGENRRSGAFFGEEAARRAGILVSPGHLLMNIFINNWGSFIEKYR